MGYQLQWGKYSKNTWPEISYEAIIQEFQKDKPQIVAIDTETNGLNIISSKPFLMIIAWKVPSQNIGKSFAIEYNAIKVSQLLREFSICNYIIGANTKYDLHMLRNGGSPFPFEILNEKCMLTDIQILKRLTMYADDDKEQMGLKHLAKIHVDPNAATDEQEVKQIKMQIKRTNVSLLKTWLKPYSWNYKDVIDKVEDPRYGVETLPLEIQEVYKQWAKEHGEATYEQIFQQSPNEMLSYAIMDGVLTLEVFLHLWNDFNSLNSLNNNSLVPTFIRENKLIEIYYKQEATGFKVDMDYLVKSKHKLSEEISLMEQQLHLYAGTVVSENQHKELIKIFISKYNIPESHFVVKDKITLDKTVLKKLLSHSNEQVKNFANTILRLRKFRKFIATYIDSFYQKVLENGDGRYHPSIRQTGTTSGRVSGDLQQQPKDPLLDLYGNELFHPRKVFIPTGNNYPMFVLQDYDQMELRVQAHYTIQFGCMDKNLCKIFMPVGCTNKYTKEAFDFNNQEHFKHYLDKEETGDSVWLDSHTLKPWIPIDPHGMHVDSAFGTKEQLGEKEYKHLRAAAKTINFSVNYGSGLTGLKENPLLEEYPEEIINKIFGAYKENFAGITKYQQIVGNKIKTTGQVINMYGRMYRLKDPRNSYKCGNYLIQGSCADLVKTCLVNIDEFIKANKLRSRVLFSIHDEIIWEVHKEEGWVIQYIENILNQTATWCKVPLTCGTDITWTSWAEKKDISKLRRE